MDINRICRDVIKFYKRRGITLSPPHKRYLKRLRKQLRRLYPSSSDQEQLAEDEHWIVPLLLLDLEPLRPQLAALYSPKPRGTPPRDPVEMLRSLLCMALAGDTLSFTTWVKHLRSRPLLAALSGFDPKARTPGIGTFYAFAARLYPERTDPVVRKPLRRPQGAPSTARPRPGIVKHLVDQALARHDQPLQAFPALRLNHLLKAVVLRSAALGLLGDLQALTLAGDGTKFPTGARRRGRKLCDCAKRGEYRCGCPRRYTDRFATWGWDHYRHTYVFGHAYYELTVASSAHDLPLLLLPIQAQEHDSVPAVKALERARKLYPEFHFSTFLGDSAHDNYPFYTLLARSQITPIIALNERRTGHHLLDSGFTTDLTGVPVCPKGEEMVHNGFCPDRCRIKWRCPRTLHHTSEPCACSPSAYGRVFFTKPEDDPRLFTHPPRHSAAWKTAYKHRTSTERSHKRKKIDFELEAARVRSRRQWAVRLLLLAICQHAAAWATQM